jgi:hypothetical protein
MHGGIRLILAPIAVKFPRSVQPSSDQERTMAYNALSLANRMRVVEIFSCA